MFVCVRILRFCLLLLLLLLLFYALILFWNAKNLLRNKKGFPLNGTSEGRTAQLQLQFQLQFQFQLQLQLQLQLQVLTADAVQAINGNSSCCGRNVTSTGCLLLNAVKCYEVFFLHFSMYLNKSTDCQLALSVQTNTTLLTPYVHLLSPLYNMFR